MLFATYTIALFCFLCWLQYSPQQSQETTSNSEGDAMEPQSNESLAVDNSATTDSLITEPVLGWNAIEPDTSWHRWDCPLQLNTWNRADDLMSHSIRELKKLASTAHIKNYSHMKKAELIEALLSI